MNPLIIKLGGVLLDSEEALERLFTALVNYRESHQRPLVIVHGGGCVVDELMKQLAAGGFKDITRIASSSPVMWQNICASNREQILVLMDKYTALLSRLRSYIEASDEQALLDFFQSAKDYRDSLSLPNIKTESTYYELFVDLPDETGGIAKVSRILADAGISIKNIGIVNNREFEEGILHISFADERSRSKAKELLDAQGYTTHLR